MTSRPHRRLRCDEEGSTVPATVFAMTLALVFLVVLVELAVWLYGRGVVRAALDEGARAGAPADAGLSECQARSSDVLDDLLGGALGDGVTVRCTEVGDRIVAEADVVFQAWLPASPDWSFEVAASARKEEVPQ